MTSLFDTEGILAPVMGFYPGATGWNPEWAERFDEKYGYDPEKAKALLAEAGYPDGFEVVIPVFPLSGAPEMGDGAEVMAGYLREIGIKSTIEEMDFASFIGAFIDKEIHNQVVPWRDVWLYPHTAIKVYNYSSETLGIVHVFEHEEIDTRYETLAASVDADERAQLLREIGDFKFENYSEVPIAWLPGQLAINPGIISEYIFPGNITGTYTHFEYAKSTQ
jgi:ABC-type transport system substrate-binding protein